MITWSRQTCTVTLNSRIPPGVLSIQDELADKIPTAEKHIFVVVQTTRRYGPLRRPTSSSCIGLRPRLRLFLPFGQKKRLLCFFGPFLANVGVR